MSLYKDFLDTAVLQDKKPITYKALARQLGVHVNTAKQALFEYAANNPSVYAVYCVTGTIATSNEDTYSILIVREPELEETKKKFKKLTGIHVYGVASYGPKDFSIFVAANKDIPYISIEDRIKCGALKNDNVKQRKMEAKPIITTPLQSTGPSKVDKPTAKSKFEENSVKGSATTTTANKAKTSSKSSAITGKRKYGLSFEKAVPKTAKPPAVEEKPKPEISRVEAQNKKGESDHEISDEELDRRMARSNIQADDIFSDEDEHMKDTVPEKRKKRKLIIEEDEEMEDVDDELDQNFDQIDARDDNADSATLVTSAAPPAFVAPAVPAAPAGKAMRKVLKKKTSKNALTEDVWEWEAVDAEPLDETKPAAKTNMATTPSNTTKKQPVVNKKPSKKNAAGEQRSLLSFWGK
ncbi:hypothetical protein DFQ28_009675 [Apophysomyces sp. BC1034]|nr:hypothetical protein DFQ30_009357 [Apophysomyces sp. BC1015]KAG0172549.1 hypothetical protein DFQ29_008329 [Apophysomyces sp. BC1021]KAG0185244.1 hypothetical protein DFQ28_009675 [Apophysomyces sp. BC1034]